ncbi:MAG: zinc ribbon domain-containing protein [Acidobacteria bacterium]|nr:zinc ribbon domain-containing protein [Acidobacteriota bacterium]
MYCPRCAVQNLDDAKFCRACGANVSLVPQALTGHLPESITVDGKGRETEKDRRDDPPNLSDAIVKTFVGIAFILVALSVKNVWQMAGHVWWFWMLIPAAGSLGSGIAEFVRLNGQQKPNQLTGSAYMPPAISATPHTMELPPRRSSTSEIYTPSSVTENTTKLLDKDL